MWEKVMSKVCISHMQNNESRVESWEINREDREQGLVTSAVRNSFVSSSALSSE